MEWYWELFSQGYKGRADVTSASAVTQIQMEPQIWKIEIKIWYMSSCCWCRGTGSEEGNRHHQHSSEHQRAALHGARNNLPETPEPNMLTEWRPWWDVAQRIESCYVDIWPWIILLPMCFSKRSKRIVYAYVTNVNTCVTWNIPLILLFLVPSDYIPWSLQAVPPHFPSVFTCRPKRCEDWW